MITIVLTLRNREISIVQNCLDSLKKQTDDNFEIILVDYGSELNYLTQLEHLLGNYPKIKFISCPVQNQLWNKSRAINIALKQTATPYFMVGDIDLLFHPDFIKTVYTKVSNALNKAVYFKYGFLSEKESLLKKDFKDYDVYIQGNVEITGTSLFPTEKLMEVNGFDEFYHGWGAEDTDIHIRLKQLGLMIEFYDEEILVKHQWHPKAYRSKCSTNPYHSALERINNSYMNFTQTNNRVKANLYLEWGVLPSVNEYKRLTQEPHQHICIDPIDVQLSALTAHLKNYKNEVIQINIQEVTFRERAKQKIKQFLKKKYTYFLSMENVNNILLEEIIKNYRNQPYQYKFDRKKGNINLTICF